MKQKTQFSGKSVSLKIIVSAVILALLLVLGVWYFLSRQKPTVEYKPQYSTPTSNQTTGITAKDAENNAKSPTYSTNQTTSNTTDQVPVAASGSVQIVDLNQKDGYVNAKAVVSDFSTTQCVYSFTAQNARPVIRQVNGVCAGISIPQTEFEIIGTYTLTVTAYSAANEKVSATKDITVQ